jgi:signal transduction histidine kinase
MSRSVAAVALLLAVAAGQLADALLGGQLMGLPVLLLVSAGAGYLVGVTTRSRVAAPAVVVSAAALTWAYQLGDPGAYPVLDDFVFALLVVGAPALAGAAVRGRAAQVRELDRLAGLLESQRRAEVRAAQLEERNRVEVTLHRGFSEQVAAITMRAESALGADADDARVALADVEAAARAGLDELRAALGSLRGDADPAGVPTPPARPTVSTTGEPPAEAPVEPPVEPPVGPADVLLAAGCGLLIAIETVVSPQAQGPAAANAAVGLLAGLPLVVRRHRPVTACAATPAVLAVMSLWLTPPTEMVTTILAVLVCGYTVGAHARRLPTRLAAGAALLAGLVAAVWASPPASREDDGVVPVLMILGLAVLVGSVTAGWTDRAARRRAALAELERRSEVDVGLAVAEQRNRLASELHDTVAHAMTVICLQASAGQVRPGPEQLDTILTTARASLEELRQGLDNLGEGHELGVAALTAAARRAGLSPQVRVNGSLDDVSPQARQVAARVVREAITNAGRYAPGAGVCIEVTAGEVLRLSVVDDGSPGHGSPGGEGLADAGAGTGLTGLAAEAERAGGTLSWGPVGAGFEVTATLPGVGVAV